MLQEVIKEVVKSTDLQPLQYLAAVRVVISVSESEDFQYMIGSFRETNRNDGSVEFSDGQWKQLSGNVRRKFAEIGVLNKIIDIVLKSLWPISFEIFKWILYHVDDTGIDCSPNFCWTPHVNIDYVKTAENLTRNEALDIKKRFKLACFHCLDSEVRSLWEHMTLAEKRSFYGQDRSFQNPIVRYWTDYMQRKQISDQALELFKFAVKNGYLSATNFFFGKLKLRIRTRMISNSIFVHLPRQNKPQCIVKDQLAIACFLICQLRSDYKGYIDLGLVFRYFLEWPMQKHFMTVVNRHGVFYYFWKKTFGYLLEGIIEKYIKDFKDHDYKELFMEFWHQNPQECKTYVSTDTIFGFRILVKFVKKHFGFVFDENAIALRAKFRAIIFQEDISEDVTDKENVEFFKFLVRERVTTKTFIDRFSHDHLMGANAIQNYILLRDFDA